MSLLSTVRTLRYGYRHIFWSVMMNIRVNYTWSLGRGWTFDRNRIRNRMGHLRSGRVHRRWWGIARAWIFRVLDNGFHLGTWPWSIQRIRTPNSLIWRHHFTRCWEWQQSFWEFDIPNKNRLLCSDVGQLFHVNHFSESSWPADQNKSLPCGLGGCHLSQVRHHREKWEGSINVFNRRWMW